MEKKPMASVRLAKPDDAAPIALAHVRAWQAAYRGLMPESVLEGMDVEARTKWWRSNLENSAAVGPTVLVVEDDDGQVVGFASVGPTRGNVTGPPGELWAINLNPERWGRGLGRLLLDAAERALGELGYDQAMLWVLAENERARRFYELSGWVLDGVERRGEERGFELHEVRYAKRLSPSG